MNNNSNFGSSGEGSRPTTDGGVDNVGGANSFTPGQASPTSKNSPKPSEKMEEKKADKDSMKQDDSAPADLPESPDENSNTEPVRTDHPTGR